LVGQSKKNDAIWRNVEEKQEERERERQGCHQMM
jgi:hypothetical protein